MLLKYSFARTVPNLFDQKADNHYQSAHSLKRSGAYQLPPLRLVLSQGDALQDDDDIALVVEQGHLMLVDALARFGAFQG